jgi:hypothetical protein
MADYRFERQSLTPHSEQYLIVQGDQRVGRVDLHFTSSVVYGSLAVEEKLTENEIMELVDIIDEDLVTSADVPRDDFVVSVYQGREVGMFSDELFEEDLEFEERE